MKNHLSKKLDISMTPDVVMLLEGNPRARRLVGPARRVDGKIVVSIEEQKVPQFREMLNEVLARTTQRRNGDSEGSEQMEVAPA